MDEALPIEVLSRFQREGFSLGTASAAGAGLFVDPVELRGIQDRPTLEQLSVLVEKVAHRDFREWAKRFSFPRGSELRDYWETSRNPVNAYRREPLDEEERRYRIEKLASVETGGRAIYVSPQTVLYRYDVPIDHLPAELEGTTILHLSDIHFREGNPWREHELVHLCDALRALRVKPDLVIGTGDFITQDISDWRGESTDCLDRFDPSIAKIAVLGNHDFYGESAGEVRAYLKRLGFIDLTNRQMSIVKEGKRLNLFGVDDHLEGIPVPPQVLSRQENETNILVTHNLDAVQSHFPECFDLVLSGHTHAGEVNLGPVTGSGMMRFFGYLDVLNGHTKGWSALTKRTLSYISPGHATRFFRFRTYKAGGTLLRLTSKRPNVGH